MITWFATEFWSVPIPDNCIITYDRNGLSIKKNKPNELNINIKFLYKEGRETDLTDLIAYSEGKKSSEYLESYKIDNWKGFLREDNKLFLRNGYHFLIIEINLSSEEELVWIIKGMKKRKRLT